MADGMAKWVEKDWVVKTKEDLDEYTYYVAGLVGVMLSDIWEFTTVRKQIATWRLAMDEVSKWSICYGIRMKMLIAVFASFPMVGTVQICSLMQIEFK